MNFRLILILTLGLLIFASQILFGIIFYNSYNSAETGKKIYENFQWLYFGNVGVLLLMIVINGLLFLKA